MHEETEVKGQDRSKIYFEFCFWLHLTRDKERDRGGRRRGRRLYCNGGFIS